ncbi:MAG TPA: hypothetical protein VHB46_12560 [Burkholderiales bacterium]|nr:hypothetical protein [Burkholderiales bacterium]
MSSVNASPRSRSAPSSFEGRWKLSRMRANEAAASGRHELAESHYLETLRLARMAIGRARHDGATQADATVDGWLAIWVDSHLEYADFLADGGEFETALSLGFEAYEQIVTALHDTQLNARVHGACLRRLKPLMDGLRTLMDRAGMPECHKARVIEKAQALALGYWNVWT